MQWLGQIITKVWRLLDTTVLRIDFTMQWKVGFICHMTFSKHCGLSSICAIAYVAKFFLGSVSNGDNWRKALIFYRNRLKTPCRDVESTIPKSPFFSKLHEHYYFPLMPRLPNLPSHFVQHGRGPCSRIVHYFVDDPPNIPFPQHIVLISVSHAIK